ncbi:carboxylesterase family protein [Actinopolymorpha pittospori]|uniref:Carboxylic ester hydrolase n=1 Tax=Actinopolymorpha pittospori TaxID=648752 RepID=A0A927R9R2_9ACTN|nr:para-nitrobenzyl esterase [Actinopolymorpha pittospori]
MNPIASPTTARHPVPAPPRRRSTRILAAIAAATAVVGVGACGTSSVAFGEPSEKVAAGRLKVGSERRDPAVVRTDSGAVRGVVAADHRSFLGVPYAAPPEGVLRWRSPTPVEPWSGTRDATAPGPGCAQLQGLPTDHPSEAEDCLYLNVTTPGPKRVKEIGKGKLPVMVWIHGGHFTFGQGDVYGGGALATGGDVIVVSMNYRLGPLGFLAHPALDADGDGDAGADTGAGVGAGEHTSGNFGLEDQQAALRWVRRNAAAFGGDPNNVTLFGQSAGATSVCAHLAAPGSAGLFDRAIMQSNSCTAPTPAYDTAEQEGLALAAKLGCTDPDPAVTAACLRKKSAATLIAAAGFPGQGFNPGPVTGGSVLPVDPARALATGRIHKVPVMIGTTHDEYRAQLWGMERTGMNCPDEQAGPEPEPCPLTDAQYTEQLRAVFGDRANAVAARYPVEEYGSASEALAAAMTDYEYVRPALDADALFARDVATYAYEFADPKAPFFAGEPETLFTVGYADPLDAGQRRLSGQMIEYWARFAHTGNPNSAKTPAWPRFDSRSRYVQSLAPGNGGIRRTDLARDHHYDFWATLGR